MAGSIKKEGNSWYYVLELGKDLTTGKRKQKKKRGFKTKKEAQASYFEALNEINKGNYIEPSKTLFAEYLSDWLDDKKTKVMQSTWFTYKWLVEKYIIKSLGNVELSKLTPMIIQRFYNELVREEKIALENIQKIHSLINNALKRAEKWGLVHRNVAALVERPKANKKEIKVWTVDEVKEFLLKARQDRLYVSFLLAVTTGMRQAEILGLRWQDVDFEDCSLSIVQILSHDGKVLKTGTKTKAGMRKVHLPVEAMEFLKRYKRMVTLERKQNEAVYIDNDLIVSTSVGTPVIPRNLVRSFYRIVKNAGLKKIRFHDLRHTHATLLLKQGVNPKIVSERLGHTDTRMTLDTYSHLLPSMQKDTANNFGKMLFG